VNTSDDVSSPLVRADPDAGSALRPSASRPPTGVPVLVLIRHGETEWSRTGRHTGRTDIDLTPAGERQALQAGAVLRRLLGDLRPSAVLCSPRRRAIRTAELAGFRPQKITADAAEWDYGELEGLTSGQIQQRFPGWTIWSGNVPGGEDAAMVTNRIDQLLAEVAQQAGAGPVLVFSHGHASRCIAARWLAEPVSAGRHYWLGTGAVSSLGYEHDYPVILQWNLDNSLIEEQP
jgi:broad specificity phosphatase PhoE